MMKMTTKLLAWRLATLVLLIIGALVGFLSLVFEIIEICLDATRTLKCLKAMSGLSLAMLAFASTNSSFQVELPLLFNIYLKYIFILYFFQPSAPV